MHRVLAAALLLSAGVACGHPEAPAAVPEEEVIPVAAEAARLGSVRAVLHAAGLIVPAAGAEFLAIAPEPARILEVSRTEGDAVASGDLLVRLDIPSATSDAARQRADAAQARAAVESARVTQTRARDLAERGLIARRDLEDADRAVADAQTALTRAEALLEAADAAAARTVIHAPFDGIVVKQLRNPGDLVSGAATDPILRLIDPTRVEVRALIPVKDLSRVLPGASARIAGFGDASTVRLRVASQPGAHDAGPEGMVSVLLAPLDPLTLPVDTPVQVDIDLEERANAVMVTPEAVVGRGAEAAVFVAAGGRAERRPVTVGVASDEDVEIVSGLRAGELVIVRGQTGLADGATISVLAR